MRKHKSQININVMGLSKATEKTTRTEFVSENVKKPQRGPEQKQDLGKLAATPAQKSPLQTLRRRRTKSEKEKQKKNRKIENTSKLSAARQPKSKKKKKKVETRNEVGNRRTYSITGDVKKPSGTDDISHIEWRK